MDGLRDYESPYTAPPLAGHYLDFCTSKIFISNLGCLMNASFQQRISTDQFLAPAAVRSKVNFDGMPVEIGILEFDWPPQNVRKNALHIIVCSSPFPERNETSLSL